MDGNGRGPAVEAEVRLKREALEWREIDGEVVALEGDASLYLATNPTGTLLWERLAAGATPDDLADVLVETYGIEPELARRDTEAFLAQAREFGLLEER